MHTRFSSLSRLYPVPIPCLRNFNMLPKVLPYVHQTASLSTTVTCRNLDRSKCATTLLAVASAAAAGAGLSSTAVCEEYPSLLLFASGSSNETEQLRQALIDRKCDFIEIRPNGELKAKLKNLLGVDTFPTVVSSSGAIVRSPPEIDTLVVAGSSTTPTDAPPQLPTELATLAAEAWAASRRAVASLATATIVVVTTPSCPYCKRAKAALTEAGHAYEELDVGSKVTLLHQIRAVSSMRTVPQIFVAGKCLGGCDALLAAMQDGSFQQTLDDAKGQPALPPALLAAAQRQAALDSQDSSKPALPQSPRDAAPEALKQVYEGMQKKGSTLKKTWARIRDRSDPVRVFTAADLVKWAMEARGASADEAEELGRKLQAARLISHVGEAASEVFSVATPASSSRQFLSWGDAPRPQWGRALNTHLTWFGPARPAMEVSAELRSLIAALYDRHLSPDGRAVSYGDIARDPLWPAFTSAAAELQKVELEGLPRDQLMCFAINLYNALIIHTLVAYIPAGQQPSSTQRSQLFSSAAKYNIGGLDYSADDLEHGILRGNRPNAFYLMLPGFLRRRQFSSSSDPRAKWVVGPPLDPRIHFALVCGAKSCPPIKLYSPDTLEEGLQGAAEAFCSSEVEIDVAGGRFKLSKIFQWYAADFGGSQEQQLRWIARVAGGRREREILAVLDSGRPWKVEYKPYDWSLNSAPSRV